ncbi:ABC transporter substrate-binding protein [Nonomuraea sp. NPDC049758]|uniref:ABC transporter substrate-binding protein n=1 Tax=Nonomuraea sp. NPDC049758 TaxID=3154360 RepID=UPI00341BC4D7
MTTKVGFFPQNNTLWVARHLDLLPGVEWVDLNALGRGELVDPTRALPSAHGDHLFDGGYDFIGTGSTPPVTAQAKGHDIVYVAISGPRVENGRLVVRDDSPIGSVAELKGRRVALGHGSWQTTLLLLALERAGLGWGDIVPVDAYGNAAELLVNGDVDAWVGSYPYLTPVESRTRTLVETEGLFSHRSLWFTRRDFAQERPEELARIVTALQRADSWTEEHPREAAALFDGDLDAWEHALRTRPWGLHPVSAEFVAEQQHVADLFHANGLIERKITVADAVLPEIGELVTRTR